MRDEIDIFALTAPCGKGQGGTLSGQCALAGLERLILGLPPQADTQVRWSLRGEGTAAGRRFIEVHAQAEVTLECQRCLQPFVFPLRVDNRLEVVRNASELEGDDAEEIERIVGSPRFDVLEFVEDELILSLPSVPKHEVCPSGPDLSGSSGEPDAEANKAGEANRPSPFAALERLKKDRS